MECCKHLVWGIVIGIAANGASGSVAYTIQGLLGGDTGSESGAYTVSNAGDVGGYIFDRTTGRTDAVVWRNGIPVTIAQSVGVDGGVTAINDSGTAVGYVAVPTEYAFTYQGFGWNGGDTSFYPDLAHPSGFWPMGINNEGTAVGISNGLAAKDTGGVVTTLAGIDTAYIQALAINNAGLIVGGVTPDTTLPAKAKAFVWDHGAVTYLPSAGGRFDVASAVNDAGVIAGTSRTADGQRRAAVWSEGAISLLTLPSDEEGSYATSINQTGEVVGTIFGNDGAVYASLWIAGQPLNLNSLIPSGSGWDLTKATDINDLGQIVGMGFYNGQQAAFLLTLDGPSAAVPEPTACALAGLVTIGTILRRRRRHPAVHAA